MKPHRERSKTPKLRPLTKSEIKNRHREACERIDALVRENARLRGELIDLQATVAPPAVLGRLPIIRIAISASAEAE